MLMACGGDPSSLEARSPRSERKSDEARAERKRKKKAEERRRREQEEADAREAKEREERKRKREAQEEDGAQETRVAAKEEEPAPASEDPDEIERRERKERIRKREEAEAKAAAAKEKKTNKKKKKVEEEAEEADEEVAEEQPKAKKKKNVEQVEEADEEVADEETRSTPFKKKEPKQTAAQKKAAEKKAAAEARKQAAAEKLAEKKAAEEAKKQAAAEKKAAAEAEKKKAAEEKVADEAEEEPAEEESPKVAKTEKRKAKAKPEEEKVDESEIEVDTASLPPPDPSEESNELDLAAGTPTRDEEPVAVAPSTYAIDRRPLTLGRGKIDVHGGLVATAMKVQINTIGTTKTASAQGLALGATYGIGAKGELGFDYTLGLRPGDVKGPLLFHGAYVAKQTEKLDLALSLGLAIDFIDQTDPMTMMTSTRAAKALQVGVWARYHVGPKLSAFTGLPALPSSAGSLGKSAPLPPIPYQLSIGLSSLDAIALDLPAGLGYQASPKLYTFGALDFARLGMNNATSALVFSDFIPISLGGFYAMPKMDIGAVFSDDLKQAADYLRFDVVVRYSIK